MWIYEKKLQYPVNICTPDVRMAKLLMAQYGGPDSELAAGVRYLTQRFSMPDNRCRATVNDIGTEELAHWEMIGTMIYQCMRGASIADIKAAGLAGYYTMHDHG
ncbi:MAG TPA: manganese catalase family protein, partial [Feifaniaceae bacterium]|nr:manganese catalase family protein [Feifaniaceae bacterium]